ncbi:hypothetical protein, partial [Halorhodospira halochloris]|uniref:hypothetical protein n=1 Tax=Halorhodospira halochloris TaxID=1052 RepID=UPI001EE8C6FD
MRRDILRNRPAYQVFGLPPDVWSYRADEVLKSLINNATDNRPGVVSHERMSSPWRCFGERVKKFRGPS